MAKISWEYKVIDCNHLIETDYDCDMLNELGADGWELVSVTIVSLPPWVKMRFFLKREIQ